MKLAEFCWSGIVMVAPDEKVPPLEVVARLMVVLPVVMGFPDES